MRHQAETAEQQAARNAEANAHVEQVELRLSERVLVKRVEPFAARHDYTFPLKLCLPSKGEALGVLRNLLKYIMTNRLSANQIEFEFSRHALAEEAQELERVLVFSWEARHRDIENRLKFFNEEYHSCQAVYDLKKQQLLARAGLSCEEELRTSHRFSTPAQLQWLHAENITLLQQLGELRRELKTSCSLEPPQLSDAYRLEQLIVQLEHETNQLVETQRPLLEEKEERIRQLKAELYTVQAELNTVSLANSTLQLEKHEEAKSAAQDADRANLELEKAREHQRSLQHKAKKLRDLVYGTPVRRLSPYKSMQTTRRHLSPFRAVDSLLNSSDLTKF